MKKFLFLLLITISFINLHAQDFIWSNYSQGNGNIEPKGIVLDNQDNSYSLLKIDGTVNIFGNNLEAVGTSDIVITKIDDNGELIWLKHIIGKGFDEPTDIVISSSNEIYILGMFNDSLFFPDTDPLMTTGSFDVFLAKLNINGDFEFSRNLIYADDNSLQVALSMELDFTNSLVVGGYFLGKAIFGGEEKLSNGKSTNYFAKFNKNGDYIWSKEIYGTNNANTIYNVVSTNNGYYAAGVFKDSIMMDVDTLVSVSDALDAFIYKMNLNGIGQWVRVIKGAKTENFSRITKDDDNNIYVIGYHNSLDFAIDSTDQLVSQTQFIYKGGTDIFLAKYSPNGTLSWGQSFGGVSNDFGSYIISDQDYLYITGQFSDFIIFNEDTLNANSVNDRAAYISKVRNTGSYINAKSINGNDNGQDIGRNLVSNSIGEVIFGGYSLSNTLSIRDSVYTNEYPALKSFFLTKYGCLPLSIDSESAMDLPCNPENAISEGAISLSASGGFSDLLYSIDGGETFSPEGYFAITEAGDYQVVVKDSSGCEITGSSLTVSQPEVFEITGIDSVDVTEFAGSDGSITVSVAGGTQPYEFVMNDGTPQALGAFTDLTAGKYKIIVQDANDCGPLETDSITLEEPPSALKEIGIDVVKVYPNPASDWVNLEFSASGQEDIIITILDTYGRTILSKEIRSVNGFVNERLDLSELDNGLYFVRIGNENEVLKLIKK